MDIYHQKTLIFLIPSMARSKESIAKRANKRGISIQEQKLKDSVCFKDDKSESNSLSTRPTKSKVLTNSTKSTNQIDLILTQPTDIKTKQQLLNPSLFIGCWNCCYCKNINFAIKVHCNRCMRPKHIAIYNKITITSPIIKVIPQPIPIPIPIAIVPLTTTHVNEVIQVKTESILPKPAMKSINWAKQADEDKLKENNRLRELLLKEIETGEKVELTEDERKRATILIERSKRKRKTIEIVI